MTPLRHLPSFLIAVLMSSAAMAQSTSVADSDELLRIIAEAQQSGAQVVVVQVPQTGPLAMAPAVDPSEQVMKFRNRFAAIVVDATSFPGEALATIRSHDPDGGLTWPIVALVFVAVFLAVGAFAERYFQKWGRSHFLYLFNPTPHSRAEKISYLLLRGLMMFAGLAVQIVIAAALVVAFADDQEHVRNTQLLAIALYAAVRALSIFFFNLLAPDTPSHRMLHLSDEDANGMHRGLIGLFILAAIILGMCAWMDMLELQRSAHKLSLTAGTFVSATLAIAFFLWQKRALSGMIMGPDEQAIGLGRRLFAKNAHVLVVVYFAVAWCIAAYRIVLDLPDAMGLIGGPVVLTFGAIAAYGVALLFIEWSMTRRRPSLEPAAGTAEEVAEAPALLEAHTAEPEAETQEDETAIAEQPRALKLL
ncbi:MAG: hypothetical protein OEN20_01880, partial [Gammaproteobacteria bacterium]|nr:hypothetical protein [Gammaproteobacteria bacterium]